MDGDFSIFEKWKVGFQTGYDFQSKTAYRYHAQLVLGPSLLGIDGDMDPNWSAKKLQPSAECEKRTYCKT